MRSIFKYYLFCLLVLLVSCGVKKNVATNVKSTPAETEKSEVLTAADTLPDFLRKFANDSTIHINWKYGIPFIIDESVPMFLPPIDKNPEGYVNSQSYKVIEGYYISARNTYYYGSGLSACGLENPIDSLPWLNKCINDLRDYGSPANKNLEPTHQYATIIKLIIINDQHIFNIIVLQETLWLYWHKDYHKRLESKISYYYDCEGNLLGKMHMEMPVSRDKHPTQPIPLREAIPNYNKFKETYFLNASVKGIGSVVFMVIFPNTDYIKND